MIVLRDLQLRRGIKVLFEGASLTFNRGQKIGVTGANGTGKSSLFALLLGEIHQDAGEFEIQPGLVVAHVAQETPATDQLAIEYVLDGDAELRQLEGELQAAEHAHDGTRIAELHEDMQRIGAYSSRARAAQLMHGLGFAYAEIDRPVAQFSGGWRVRLNLARALMCRSDILLLDEPTNHLDLDAIVWLEQWLGNYPGTLLLISHDRDFLDAVADAICHIEGQRLRLYAGNYSAFETQRAAQLAQQQATFLKQQREIAHLQSFIDRFKAKASKARQAQSRIKALARMENIAAAHVDTPFEFAFRPPAVQPDPVLRLDESDAGYGDVTVLRGICMTLRAGTRLGLLGRNGAGKSTMMKVLAGALAPLTGQRVEGKGLQIGYFAQHQLEQLRPDESPLWHLTRLSPRTREQELRNFLGGFNFHGDQVIEPVAPMSGGEKSRLALALIVWQRPNLLLLDEPTNHLDLEMRHALTLGLQDYEGALVLVSHDRSLLRATADELWLVEGGTVEPFDGDLEDYARRLRAKEQAESQDAVPVVGRKEQKRLEAEERNRRFARRKPLEARLKSAEREIETLGMEKVRLEKLIASPDIYADTRKDDLKRFLLEQAQVAARLHQAEERWLTLSAELEQLAAQE
ncbi:MAG TPA: ATP-binding cassette domain-containing protein [Burkholderiales bacterium]|jgi:ATP-binding cassette subfamily F protein 3|nr:ATP-binding cassette domain-containing protein [Burkholderiales bacterium]